MMIALAVLQLLLFVGHSAWQDVCDHAGCQLVTALDIYDELGEVHVHFEHADPMIFTADVGSFEHFDTDVTLEEGTHQEVVMWRTFEDDFENLGIIVEWRNGWSGNLPVDSSERLVFHACPDSADPCTVAELQPYPSDVPEMEDDEVEEPSRRVLEAAELEATEPEATEVETGELEAGELEADDCDSLFCVLKAKRPEPAERRRLQDLRGKVPISLTVIYADNIGSNANIAEEQATQVVIWTNAAMHASHIPAKFFVNAVTSGSGFSCSGARVDACKDRCKVVYQSLPADKRSDMYMCIVENYNGAGGYTVGQATFNGRHFVVRNNGMDSKTPTHEIGHMMGALHENLCNRERLYVDGEWHENWVGYKGTCGKTYANGRKKTIMARYSAPGVRQWLFSNTRVQDSSGDHPGDADHNNARFMNLVLSDKMEMKWDEGLKHYGLEVPSHSCEYSNQLGVIANVDSAEECANYMMNNPGSCRSETFMWSPYSYSWGCRCCTDNPSGWQAHQHWSIYQINPWKEISNAIPDYWSCRISSTTYNSLNEAKFACRQNQDCGAVFYAAHGWSLRSGYYRGGKHYLMRLTTGCHFPPATGRYGNSNKFYVRNGHVSSNGAQAWIY